MKYKPSLNWSTVDYSSSNLIDICQKISKEIEIGIEFQWPSSIWKTKNIKHKPWSFWSSDGFSLKKYYQVIAAFSKTLFLKIGSYLKTKEIASYNSSEFL